MRYPASEKLRPSGWLSNPMSAGAPDVGKTRRHAPLLQVVRPQPDRRPGSLEDRSPKPERVCNRVPDNVRGEIVQLALDEPELSPRELATRFTDSKSYFVSEASVYRLLKDHDLIARRPPMSSRTRRRRRTSFGRPTSPISRSSAGAGSTCLPCSTTSRATSWPGSCARLWRLAMYRIRCRWRCRPQVWTRSRSRIGRAY